MKYCGTFNRLQIVFVSFVSRTPIHNSDSCTHAPTAVLAWLVQTLTIETFLWSYPSILAIAFQLGILTRPILRYKPPLVPVASSSKAQTDDIKLWRFPVSHVSKSEIQITIASLSSRLACALVTAIGKSGQNNTVSSFNSVANGGFD